MQEGARLEDVGVGLASIRHGWVCIKRRKQSARGSRAPAAPGAPGAPGAPCEVQDGARLEDVGVGLASIRHGWACIKARKQTLFVYACGDFVRSVRGARCEVSGARCTFCTFAPLHLCTFAPCAPLHLCKVQGARCKKVQDSRMSASV